MPNRRNAYFGAKKMKQLIGIILITLTLTSLSLAQPFRAEINKGNDYYKKGWFEKAQEIYSKIIKKQPKNKQAEFNLGNSLYKQGNFEASQQIYGTLTKEARSNRLKEQAYYNLGNSLFRREDYKSAINAYEEALKINPKDKDAKFNLELAKKMLQQPKKKDQDKEKDQEEEKDKEKQQQEQPKPKPGEMSKEDAERILKAIENQEKHKNGEKKQGAGRGQGKDW
jgi:Ca-activated chloride channel homolog